MAAAAYTTDLATFKDFEAATTLGEMAGYVTTGTPALDTDFPIQGTQHVSAAMTKTGLGSIMADFGSNVSWTSGWAFFLWGVFLPAAAVATEASGGLRLLVGTDITTNYKGWTVGGSDFGRYPYGGWQNFAVDPETTADFSGGTVTGYRWVGLGINATAAISKGFPAGLDCIRYGRGDIRVADGDLANGYATFAGMAAANDGSTARWGLFQGQSGSYLWKGLMTLGYSTAVDFRDSNRVIFVDNTKKVLPSFNTIEIRQAGSRVDWTGVTFIALGTVSKGALTVVDDADVNLASCTFTDMDTFAFLPNSTALDSIFRRCGIVTAGGATFDGCTFDRASGSAAVYCAQLSHIGNISATEFVSDGTGYAIEVVGSAGDVSLNNITFTGYAGTNGTTGNEAIFVNIATGTVNLTVSGGNSPSIRTAGATVNVVSGATVTFTGLPTECDIVILTAGTNTVLLQVDQHASTSYAWGYSGTPTVDVGFLKPGYVPFYIRNLALGSSDSSIPVSLSVDRNYL